MGINNEVDEILIEIRRRHDSIGERINDGDLDRITRLELKNRVDTLADLYNWIQDRFNLSS